MIELNFPNPVRLEKDFFDRQLEWKEIQRSVRPQECRPVIILGERRIGKTSLQEIAAQRLVAQKNLHLVRLSLPFGSAMRSTEDFARELLHELCFRLGEEPRNTGLYTQEDEFALGGFGEYAQALRTIVGEASSREFLVCVDEFDISLHNCEQADREKGGHEADRLIGLVTYLVEQAQRGELPFRFFFSMTAVPDSVTESFGSPFTSSSTLIPLTAFSRDSMEEMVLALLAPSVEVQPDALARLYELSGGHPYVVKLLLHKFLVPYDFEPQAIRLDRSAVNDALTAAVDDRQVRGAFANLYQKWFSDQEKAIMLLLASRGEGDQAGLTRQELEVLGPDYGTAARTLQDRGYLQTGTVDTARSEDKASSPAKTYRLQMGFWSHWLRGWDLYESEIDSRLKDALLRLRRMTGPWEQVEPAVIVSDKTLRDLGLRP